MTDDQSNSLEETKIIYYIDEEETPYLTKISKPPTTVTLADFKLLLNKPNYKYFFKSMDEHFGVVKEEITDDKKNLPCINGRIVSYLVCSEGSTVSSDHNVDHPEPGIRSAGIGDSRPPSFHGQSGHSHPRQGFNHALNRIPTDSDTCTDSDSVYSMNRDRVPPLKNIRGYRPGTRAHSVDPPVSKFHSDFDSSTNFDSEDELNSRMSTLTDNTLNSSNYRSRLHQRYRRNPISKASSFSSMTDSNLSLNILTVTLDMGSVNFLGISIVGQSNEGGDGGIYIGSIMKDGAVAKDGRIEPGDMILEANGISFENMSNDDAVLTLREQVQKPGPLTLVVAKSWISNPKNYFTVPAQEPVRPIDPRAWVLHTTAMTAAASSDTDNHSGIVAGGPIVPGWFHQPGMSVAPSSIRAPSMATMSSLAPGASASAFAAGLMGSSGPGLPMVAEVKHGLQHQAQPGGGGGGGSVVTASSSLPESERYLTEAPLTVNSDLSQVVQALTRSDSGLEIRDRLWLKITLPNAFIGSDLVNWLYKNVEGFTDRRDARKYASSLLKLGFIRHTVNKISFSEQCYYVFGERARNLPEKPHWVDVDSVSEVDARELQKQQPVTHQPSYFNYPPDYANPSNTTNGGSSQYSSLPAIYQHDDDVLRRRRSRSSSGSSSSSSVSHVSNERAVLPPPPN